MSAPDPAIALRNLREQVTALEATALILQARLSESRERAAMLAASAEERLQVIQKGDTLLREKQEAIRLLEQKLAGTEESVERLRRQLAQPEDRHEENRALKELAARELKLTQELLVLKKEGLLHSIVRRVRSLLT